MVRLLLFPAIAFILSVQSCSGSMNEKSDEKLNEFIRGTWTSENFETITFNHDYSFTDTVFSEIPYQRTQPLIPLYIINGKYSIKNGMIHFNHAKFIYLRNAADPKTKSYAKVLYPRSVRIENEDMFLQEIPFLIATEKMDTVLQGKWISKTWVCTFDRFNDPQFQGGIFSETLDFDTLNEKVIYTGKYLFETNMKNLSEEYTYNYAPPVIYFDRGIKTGSVFGTIAIIDEGEMRWFTKDPVYYIRIK